MTTSVVEQGLPPRKTATGVQCEHGLLGVSVRKEEAKMDT